MMLGIGIIVVGVFLLLWGIYNFRQTKGNSGTLIDLLINGSGSGLGQIIVSIIFIVIGFVVIFGK